MRRHDLADELGIDPDALEALMLGTADGPDSRRFEIREFDDGQSIFEAVAVTYNVTDDYGTRFLPGAFADSLRERLPAVHWGHVDAPANLLGEVVDYRDTPQRLEVIGQLRPREQGGLIRRAWDGMRSRILRDFSVVFRRQEWRTAEDGVTEFTRARLHRVDLVLQGAVPGAQLLATRQATHLGPVASRLAYAERLALAGSHPSIGPTTASAMREADEALRAIEG